MEGAKFIGTWAGQPDFMGAEKSQRSVIFSFKKTFCPVIFSFKKTLCPVIFFLLPRDFLLEKNSAP